MPNLIHLKDYSDIYDQKSEEHMFIKAEATRSRLMGVIGVKLYYESFILYFHLDFEEYGFDRFEVTALSDDEYMTQSVMGGLGADLVEITYKEACVLIYEAVEIGETYGYQVPLNFFEYEYLLLDTYIDNKTELYDKISVDIDTDESLLNYYLMRTAGQDHFIKKILLQSSDFDFEFSDEPTVLLKNEIIAYEDAYICQSLIDYMDAYKMVVSKVKVSQGKVVKCELVEELLMSPKEASFQLSKKEHIALFYLSSSKEFQMKFEEPQMMKNVYDSGALFTRFNETNQHVNSSVYYLNGDVFASYFVLDKQLVVTCFDSKALERVKEELFNVYQLDVMAELEAEHPILNHFITSGYKDFFEFLGE